MSAPHAAVLAPLLVAALRPDVYLPSKAANIINKLLAWPGAASAAAPASKATVL